MNNEKDTSVRISLYPDGSIILMQVNFFLSPYTFFFKSTPNPYQKLLERFV